MEDFQKTVVRMFEGRIGRKDFLLGILAMWVLPVLAWILIHGGLLGSLVSLVAFVGSLSLTVRRLHDVGQTGWFAIIGCIPFLNFLFLLVLLVWSGESKENLYGPIPVQRSFMNMLLNK